MMEEKNEIEIVYEPSTNNDKNIKIFGKEFVNNNKDKIRIIYKNKEYELKEYFKEISSSHNEKDLIILKLKGLKAMTNMNSMFYGCNTLLSLSDISDLNTINITNIGNIFRECNSLNHYQIYQNGILII